MIRTLATKVLSASLCLLLVMMTGPFGAEVQLSAQEAAPAYSGQGAPLTPEEVQGLAAPIALYPDALVAQILGGATFPDQIAIVGTEREGAHAISHGTREHGKEPQLDIRVGGGLCHPGGRCDGRGAGLARKGAGSRESEIRFADYGRAAIAASHRHSARESAGDLRSHV